MVTVTLARAWTDGTGVSHAKGAQIQIPESELDNLVAEGYVNIGGGGDGESADGIRWT